MWAQGANKSGNKSVCAGLPDHARVLAGDLSPTRFAGVSPKALLLVIFPVACMFYLLEPVRAAFSVMWQECRTASRVTAGLHT